jgi:hypothetical protein
MKADARRARTDALPHRKTYDKYVRIVVPGRHVFKTRLSPGKLFLTLVGFGASSFFVWLGLRLGTYPFNDWFGRSSMILMWAGALAVTVTYAWNLLHNTIVEVTPRRILMKRRRFVGWVEKESWDLSSFADVTLQTTVAFGRGTRAPRYWPVLEFDTWDNFTMGEGLDSKAVAEEFIRDVTASVERARHTPETF